MKQIYPTIRKKISNDRGDISIFTCFFVAGVVMLISFLLTYTSIRITCINIRNGAKMELNNLSASIYADTFRSQRETNFSEYLNTLYSDSSYTDKVWQKNFSSQQKTIRSVTSSWIFMWTGIGWNMFFPVMRNSMSLCLATIIPLSHSKLN